MIKRVIFNADDFGLTSGITRAIIEAHKEGVVNSTTVLGNCEEKLLIEAADLASQVPGLGVGAHLVLTTGKPVLDEHKTLLDERGFFKFKSDTIDESIDLKELYEEWKAQLKRLQEHFEITHIDSHHHVHLDDRLHKVVRRLSREFKLPIRSVRDNFPTEIKADLGFYGESANLQYLIDTMSRMYGLVEFMVHPGYEDDTFLQEISSYHEEREKELEILKSKELKQFLENNHIKNINYAQIHRK